MISVEAVGSVVRVEVAGCKVDLSIGEANALSARLGAVAWEAQQARYREREAARQEALRLATEEAAQHPGVNVIGGRAYRWTGDVWQVVAEYREVIGWVTSDPPPSWPEMLWFRTAGGRVRHAWKGGARSLCGLWLDFRSGEAKPCRKCEAILSAETPTTDAPSLGIDDASGGSSSGYSPPNGSEAG